jgi:folate-binding protein YgfZ
MTESTQEAEAIQLKLNDFHTGLGAAMTVRNGWMVPAHYGDVAREYAAVRSGSAGLIDLSSRGRIEVRGADAVSFLNGMITNDVKTLPDGAWFSAAFPTVLGRLVAVVRVLHTDKSFLFDSEEITTSKVFQSLSRFTAAGDFKVTDLINQLALLSIQGREAAAIVRDAIDADVFDLPRGRVSIFEWRGHQIRIIRATHTGEDGFDLFVPAESAGELWSALSSAGAVPVGQDALDILRIEAGIPRHGIDMDETNVVLETGLDEAVSFTKGCYIGQEIIARIHWRGHIAKRLSGLIIESGTVQSGDKLMAEDGKEIGRITSAVSSPQLGRNVALAFVKYDYLANGTAVRVLSGSSEAAATVVALPFVRGSWYSDDSATGDES